MAKFRRRTASQRSLRPSRTEPLPVSTPLPLYGFLEDLRRGILPNNPQLIQSLQSLQHSALLSPSPGLSANGRQTLDDLRVLFQLLVRVLQDRNDDQLIQRFLYHAGLATRTARQQLMRSGKVPIVMKPRKQVYLFGAKDAAMAAELKKLRKQATKDVRSLYSLGQLLFTSTDFRQMLKDWQALAERILREDIQAVGKEEQQVVPSIQQKPEAVKFQPSYAPRPSSPSYAPRPSSPTPRPLSPSYAPRPLSPLPSGSMDAQLEALKVQVERTTEDIRRVEQGLSGWERTRQSTASGVETRKTAEELKEQRSVEHLPEGRLPIVEIQPERDGVPVRQPSPIVTRDFHETTKQEEPTPKEAAPVLVENENQRILQDAKPLFRQLGKNEQFRTAFEELISLVTRFRQTTQSIMTETAESPALVSPAVGYDANLQAAQMDLIRLMERFANGASIDPALDVMNRFRREVEHDYQLKDWVGDWQAFLKRCLVDPDYLEHEEYGRRGEFLLDRTRELSQRGRYRQQFDEASEAIKSVIRGLGADPLTQELADCLTRLLRDDLKLAFGANPWAALASGETLNDLRVHWLPAMLRSLHEIPLPRIESHTDGSVLVLEDVVIPAESLMPADLDVRSQSHFRANPRHKLLGRFYNTKTERAVAANSGWTNSTRIRIKDNWPAIVDDGLADLEFGGKGLSIILNVVNDLTPHSVGRTRPLGDHVLEPAFVRVKIDRMRLRLHDTRRDWMYRLISPVVASRMKKQLEVTIRDRLVEMVGTLDRSSRMLLRGVSSA